jgi:hypothetical protein
MGRPRKIFKPYKDRKITRTGNVMFYVNGEPYSQFNYESPSKRKIYIERVLRSVAYMKGKEIYYVVMPTISEFNPKSEVLTLWRINLPLKRFPMQQAFLIVKWSIL